jgi:ABC-type glycerol-3-phosphate transport system substrate-binding protein
MRQPIRAVATAAVAILIFSACSSGATPSPSGGGASPSGVSAPVSAPESTPASSAFDPQSISGTVVLSGWQSTGAEGDALNATLDAFKAAYPKITLDYQPIATDYPTAMAAKFSSGEPPDLFYVDSSVAPDWIDQGVLQELDTMATERGFDTSQFYPGYLDAFKGPDGKTYGYPKDGNTLGMAYNTDMLTAAGVTPPTSWTELAAAAAKLTTGNQKAFCLSHTLDRALAFIYQNGGSLFSDDKKTTTVDCWKPPRRSRPTSASSRAARPASRRPRRRLVRQGPRREEGRDDLRGRLARPVHEVELPRHEVRLGRDAHGQAEGDPRLHRELLDRCGQREQGPGLGPADLPHRP